jgi:hypothetical protein
LFHHAPGQTDNDLDAMLEAARARWTAAGGQRARSMAAEDLAVRVATNSPAIMSVERTG